MRKWPSAGAIGQTQARLDTARTYFAAARAAGPEIPNAVARMADLELRSVAGPTLDTRASIERAGRWRLAVTITRLLHAQVLARLSDYPAARSVLGPLMSNRYPPNVRNVARDLMAGWSNREPPPGERTEVSPARPRRPQPPRAASSPSLTTPATTPVFRILEPGEQRLEGILERIECAAAARCFT